MSTSRHPLHSVTAALVVGVALLSSALPVSAAPLYEEDFLNSTGANKATGYVGWSSYIGSAASVRTNDPGSGSVDSIALTYLAGNPSTSNGFLYAVNYQTANQIFAATETFSSIAPTTISWKQGNSSTSVGVRLMIQSGGNWYATDQVFTNSSTYTASTFSSSSAADVSKSFEFTTLASAWRSVTLVSGSTLSLGSVLSSDLTSTQITGVGFYVQMPSATSSIVRVDTVTIVPEPKTTVLIGLGLIGLLFFRRRGSRA